MQFRILGPLEVVENGKQLAPSGQKARALLALLLLHANKPVASDRLVEEIWGEELPANSAKALQIQISRLRKSLGSGRLETVGGGYALVVGEGELDLDLALSLVERGERSFAEGDAAAAGSCFREALSLFDGRPLGEFAYSRFAQAELARLEELQMQAREGLIDAELALGRGSQVTGDLEALVAAHPLRERLHGQRMVALYQAGRQADALDAYQEARRRCVNELGVEPGQALQEIQRRILNQDPALAPRIQRFQAGRIVDRNSFWRRRMALLGSAAILVGALLLGLAVWRFANTDSALPARSLAMLDPETLAPTAILALGGIPSDVVVGPRAAFVAIPSRGSVVVVVARTRAAVSLGAPVRRPTRLATGRSGVWVLDGLARRVSLLGSARVHRVAAAPGRGPSAPLDAIAADARAIWLPERAAEFVFKLDPRDGQSLLAPNGGRDSFFEGDARRAIAVAAGSVWASNPVSIYPSTERLGRVSRLDSTTGEVLASIRLPAPPVAIAADDRGIWVALERGDTIWRIDPHDNVAASAVRVPGGVIDLAIDEHAVWALGKNGEVSRIDPAANVITAHTNLGRGTLVAAGAGAVWIAAA